MSSEPRSDPSGQDSAGQHGQIELSQLIEHHERVEWAAVDGISVAEAGAWTARLIEAAEGR